MTQKIEMRALMSLKAVEGRDAVKRGDPFAVQTAQEARDLERMGQAERVKSTSEPRKAAKA